MLMKTGKLGMALDNASTNPASVTFYERSTNVEEALGKKKSCRLSKN